MAQTTYKLYPTKFGYVDSNTPTGHIDISGETQLKMNKFYGTSSTWYGSRLYFEVDSIPQSIMRNRIYFVRSKFAYKPENYLASFTIYQTKETFDENTIELGTAPKLYSPLVSSGSLSSSPTTFTDFLMSPTTTEAQNPQKLSVDTSEAIRGVGWVIVNNGSGSNNYNYAWLKPYRLSDGTAVPYIEIVYDDSITISSKITVENAPQDGYVNPRESTYFSWSFEKSDSSGYDCIGEEFGQTSATLYWRVVGDENYSSISASGSTQNLTVPANTFPVASSIEWYLSGTDDGGTTSQTEVYTFSTSAGVATATLKTPINSIEDGSSPIEITWELSSSDGQQPIAVDVIWKLTSAETWNYLVTHQNVGTSYIAPSGTFPAGEIQLSVRAYNIDDIAGSWSRPSNTTYYSFICISAPDKVQGLSATEKPRTTISWQSSGQQGYEITIDGKVAVSAFGSDMRWQTETPLSDGRHTISVRIQGVYGLWSQPAEITVTIANTVPQEWGDVSLSGEFGQDALLTLVYDGTLLDDSDIYWYRDGKKIAWTTGLTAYTDRFVLGYHTYYAELWTADGDYKRTNTVAGEMTANKTVIADASGGEWIELKLSDNSENEQNFQYSRMAKSRTVLGATFPVLELSEFETLVGTYDCSFASIEDASGLEALKGKIVIVKSRGNQVIVGGLIALQRTIRHFYVKYSFSVQQIDWSDFVRYDARDQL